MATSRLASNAARLASYTARAQAAQAILAARSATSVGIDAAREAARIASYPNPTNVLSAVDTGGGTAKIMIADHVRVYPVQGAVDVADVALSGLADLTGLASATTYYPFYDDETLSDTAPAIQVTEDPSTAQSGAAPGRHSLGAITTPATGGGGTSGSGGVRPPGWGTDLPHEL